MRKWHSIYRLKCRITGMEYIGLTSEKNPFKRIRQHKWTYKNKNRLVSKHIKLLCIDGKDRSMHEMFEIEIICKMFGTGRESGYLEGQLAKSFKTIWPHGLNQSAFRGCRKHTPESKEKSRQAALKRHGVGTEKYELKLSVYAIETRLTERKGFFNACKRLEKQAIKTKRRQEISEYYGIDPRTVQGKQWAVLASQMPDARKRRIEGIRASAHKISASMKEYMKTPEHRDNIRKALQGTGRHQIRERQTPSML